MTEVSKEGPEVLTEKHKNDMENETTTESDQGIGNNRPVSVKRGPT